jgi:hypothetical protein
MIRGSLAFQPEHLSAEQGERCSAMGMEGHRLEEAHKPPQVGLLQELAEGEEPDL